MSGCDLINKTDNNHISSEISTVHTHIEGIHEHRNVYVYANFTYIKIGMY